MKRGRKTGGDVLKDLEPAGSVLATIGKLAYGRISGPTAEMVSVWRSIELESKRLEQRANQLGRKDASADASAVAEPDRIEKALDALASGSKCQDAEAIRYCEDKRILDAWTATEHKKLCVRVRLALLKHDAEWFQEVANALRAQFNSTGNDTYPLHAAVMLLGRLKHKLAPNGVPVLCDEMDSVPRYTIGELCDLLEAQGHRPRDKDGDIQDIGDWRHTVRRVCREVGLPLLPGKPGRPAKGK